METNRTTFLTGAHISIHNYLNHHPIDDIRQEILEGLLAERKYISSRYFYDQKGSDLFEQITRLPEYYPTRTEISVLKQIAPMIAHQFGEGEIIELGSGDCSKISVLLSAFSIDQYKKICYVPVDVSPSALKASAEKLDMRFPGLSIQGVVVDFRKQMNVLASNHRKLLCFFGSTLGNLLPLQSREFLIRVRQLMRPGDQFLLGLDMIKDIDILEKAYNDPKGITAAFNKNILNVINRYMSSDFDPDWFAHRAFYNKRFNRIEMHLEALEHMDIRSPYLKQSLRIRKGETIHTENSHKYSYANILDIASDCAFKITARYTDTREWFSLTQLTV